MKRGGLHWFIKRWVLDRGTWPDGLHAIPWNDGKDWFKVDFARLRFDPNYLGKAEASPFAQQEYERKMAEIERERPHVWGGQNGAPENRPLYPHRKLSGN